MILGTTVTPAVCDCSERMARSLFGDYNGLLNSVAGIDVFDITVYFRHFYRALLREGHNLSETEAMRLFQIVTEVILINKGGSRILSVMEDDILAEVVAEELLLPKHVEYLDFRGQLADLAGSIYNAYRNLDFLMQAYGNEPDTADYDTYGGFITTIGFNLVLSWCVQSNNVTLTAGRFDDS